MKAGILIVMLLLTPLLLAQEGNVITFLVPVNAPEPTPGAYGTTWITELWVHNGNNTPVKLADCGDNHTIPGLPCETDRHPPGVTQPAFPHEVHWAFPALLFHVGKDEAARLVLSSRLFELSRLTQPVGVEVPVVREDRFFTTETRFIAIPSSPDLRAALRVYDPRRKIGSSVRVAAISTEGVVLAERVLPFVYRERVVPGMAVVADLAALFSEIRFVERYDIRITPLQDLGEYWALVSVTDNDTQQVFTITAE
jgi:hypothetical protein